MWQFWLIIAGIFFIGEIITVGFLVFWLAVGALLAMITSFFIPNIIVQTAVFVISSTILIFATKPFVKRFVDVIDYGKDIRRENSHSPDMQSGILVIIMIKNYIAISYLGKLLFAK